MSDRKRIVISSVLVMAGGMFCTAAVTIAILYRTDFEARRELLAATASGHARLVEAVVKHDEQHDQAAHPSGSVLADTANIVADARVNTPAFDDTLEIVVAQRIGDQIVFLHPLRHGEGRNPDPVPWASEWAEPMRRAMLGQEGTILGLDYRGERVLAAYCPVARFGLGVVAKSDLAEVRAPFLVAGLIAGGVTVLLVLAGVGLTLRITDPLVRQLQESEQRLRLTLDAVSDGGWDWNVVTGEVRYSDSWIQSLGYTRDEVPPHISFWESIVHPDDQSRCMETLNAHLDGSTPAYDCENRLRAASGEYRWNLDRGRVVSRDGAGRPLRMVGTDTNITERKQAETELRESSAITAEALQSEKRAVVELERTMAQLEAAKQDAESANRSKSEFLANMSHEIRTPMTAILGFAENMLDVDQSVQEKLNCIHTIRRNGEHLLGVINAILDISKVEAGKLTAERIRCEPCKLIADVGSLMRVRADAKGLAFNIEYLGTFPETIRSDPQLLRQILINLVGNAIKFTTTGTVRLLPRFVDDGHEPCLQFDVIDTGRGMTEDQTARLFQPFVQAESTITREYGGTGLGLAISRRFAELLGGDVTVVATDIGGGSTFRASVPTGSLNGVKMLEDPKLEVVPSKVDNAVAPFSPSTLRGHRILLAEDGPDNQRLISFLLRKAGAHVTVVENGKLALDAALAARDARKPFDCILMDMQMPILDGFEATGLLRQQGYAAPIIALTAHAMAGDRQECIKAGCDDYASKPVDRTELIRLIATYISHGKTTPPSEENTPDAPITELAGDDMLEQVETLVSKLPDKVALIESAIDEQDHGALEELSHQLKASAGGHGSPPIADAAQKSVSHESAIQEDGNGNVLVVDDDPDARRLLRRYLELDGFRVHEACDGIDALAKAKNVRLDVILMDVAMPNMNGLDCTRRLKVDPGLCDIPVIIVSGKSDSRHVRAGIEAGAREYITKPIQRDEFLLRVRAMCRLRRGESDLLRSNDVRGEQARAMSILFDLSRSLAVAESLDAIVENTATATAALMRSRRVSVMLPDDTGKNLYVANAIGIDDQLAAKILVPVGSAIAGAVFASGEPMVCNSQADLIDGIGRYETDCFASVPLASKALAVPHKVVGVLNVTDRHDLRPFETNEIEYLDLVCNMTASAVEQFQSGQEREHAHAAIVIGLAKLAEHRDSDTGKHLERVTQFALLLARELRKSSRHAATINDRFLEHLAKSMPLHDIGKVSVSDAILLKAGPLTDAEFTAMKQHAQVGAAALQSVIERAPEASFLVMARNIAYGHHERFDGTGYPLGSRGDEIPLEARIAAVADVYDALTSKRPYKEAFPHAKAVEIIRESSGAHFDPDVAEVFLRLHQDFAELAEELRDGDADSRGMNATRELIACSASPNPKQHP